MKDQMNKSRKELEQLGTLYKQAEKVTIKPETIECVNCYWFYPEERRKPDQ